MTRFLRRAVLVGAASVAAGCSNPSTPAPQASVAKATMAGEEGEHGHKPSSRGGIVVPIGSDKYHVEAVFEKGGVLRLFTLGQNESTVLEIDTQELTGSVRIVGDSVWEPIVLAPTPQPGDKAGTTSQFVGNLPERMVGKGVVVKISSIRIGGERLRVAFESAAEVVDHGIPAKVVDEDEKKLYLTPGGKYTEADIKANGNITASQKFKGLKANHDLKPKAGDKICPITLTLASPKFTWVIDGKTYEFCCPPCVDEFVQLAKEKPSEIKAPEEYRKK